MFKKIIITLITMYSSISFSANIDFINIENPEIILQLKNKGFRLNDAKFYNLNESKMYMKKLEEKLKTKFDCVFTDLKPVGYVYFNGNDLNLEKDKIGHFLFCFNNEYGILSGSNSEYHKLSNSTFISYIDNKENGIETIETIQLDYKNRKIKYTKNINHDFSFLSSLGVFIADFRVVE